ncbi:MAG TPA: hypothetical protein VGB64_11350 [Actinomycetota bacterium]
MTSSPWRNDVQEGVVMRQYLILTGVDGPYIVAEAASDPGSEDGFLAALAGANARIRGRNELLCDPRLREALFRWEAGDDTHLENESVLLAKADSPIGSEVRPRLRMILGNARLTAVHDALEANMARARRAQAAAAASSSALAEIRARSAAYRERARARKGEIG